MQTCGPPPPIIFTFFLTLTSLLQVPPLSFTFKLHSKKERTPSISKDASNLEAKSLLKEKTIKECFAEDDMDKEEGCGDSYPDDEKKKHVSRRKGPGAGGVSPPGCVVENCRADLTDARQYHRRHKVCEFHSKAPVVMIAGLRQRFCQQCSRFHELSEFDETRRSCRRRLAGHNERRRKSTVEITS